MQRLIEFTVIVCLTLGASTWAQDEDAKTIDPVSRKASQLEAQLSKVIDTSPEAAEAMIQLVDLYHTNGRVFGLIRVGQRFIASHPTHPKHKQVMGKLIDGLVVTSRQKQIIAIARQYLVRYGKDSRAVEVEKILAQTLDRQNDKAQSAAAHEAIWKRGGADGILHGARAIRYYESINNKQGFENATRLSEQMLDKLPAGPLAADLATRAYIYPRNYSDWKSSNRIANKILKKNLKLTKPQMATLHKYMAENYRNMGQRTNAAEQYRRARGFNDNADLHRKHAEELYHATAPVEKFKAVADGYAKAYPDRDDQYDLQALVGLAYLRKQDKAKALAAFKKVLPHRAPHDIASRLVEHNGKEKPKLAESEKILLEALKTNTKDAAYLRYVLTFYLYRDRMKDLDKARKSAEQLVLEFPDDSHYTHNTYNWLLWETKDAGQFASLVKKLIAARHKHAHLRSYRDVLSRWIRDASRRKEHKARAQVAKAEFNKTSGDSLIKDWATSDTSGNNSKGQQARERIIKSGDFKKLSDAQVWNLLRQQGYSYQHYGSSKLRVKAIDYYKPLSERFPKSYEAAQWYLQAGGDYGTATQASQAAENMLKQEPTHRDPDSWRRLLAAADKAKDVALTKKAYDWISRCVKAKGIHSYVANDIGKYLDKAGLKKEAMDYWRAAVEFDANDHYARYAAGEVAKGLEGGAKISFLESLYKKPSRYFLVYGAWVADEHLKAGNLDKFEQLLSDVNKRRNELLFSVSGMDEYPAYSWVDSYRSNKEASDGDKQRVYEVVRDLSAGRASARALLSLLELPGYANRLSDMDRLKDYERSTRMYSNNSTAWDALFPFAQASLSRKDYPGTATLLTGMLNNVSNVDSNRKKAAREMVGRAYSRMGGVGMAIDESSPMAPLLQAVMYLRLGDNRLALDTYVLNKALFDKHRNEVPVDLLLFVTENHIAAGGEENHNRAEDTLRSWILKHGESKEMPDQTKAKVQLMLAKNYYSAKRYEVARSEYTTVLNRYPKSDEAVEAEFGIGESFMAQKIFDKAEQVFEKLSNSRNREVVIRAEFLRGVLANRRGDHDEARQIFRAVLDRVPSIELANQTLFNLSEVYRQEQRYIDQLELLRTVGRLGRRSKRWHVPGMALSIVVQDSDLGISRGHTKIPVLIKTDPGGDQELVYLYSGGAGKGLFRATVDTQLGTVVKGDKLLQVTGNDRIYCDYPDKFKNEFRNVPLADAEIRIASEAKFEVSSSKIVDEKKESFSERLAREQQEAEDEDKRRSQGRPTSQIKPGNIVYLRVADSDRDLSDEADKVTVKLVASSGDQLQVKLSEIETHNGIFEGSFKTGELPAGALASDNSIDHSPLKAIDKAKDTYWLSEPDGAAPKWLSVDMKDLREISRVRFYSPDPSNQAPVRAHLQGSHDGRFWFTLINYPMRSTSPSVKGEFGPMTQRVYSVRSAVFGSWNQVVDMTGTLEPVEQAKAEALAWAPSEEAAAAKRKRAAAVVWQGKFLQLRDGAVRFTINGVSTALMIDGKLEIPVKKVKKVVGGSTVDVWLESGVHDLTIFATTHGANGVTALRARENTNAEKVTLASFSASDFDVNSPEAKAALSGAGKGEKEAAATPSKPIELGLDTMKINKKSSNFKVNEKNGKKYIGSWADKEDSVYWEFDAPKPGVYAVWMNLSHSGAGSRLAIEFGGQNLEAKVPDTGSWDSFRDESVGMIEINRAGKHTLAIKPLDIANGGLMDLRGVTLKPTGGNAAIAGAGTFDFRFKPMHLRHVRLVVDEYIGEAVAINHVEIGHGDEPAKFIPTEADVLALATNDVLELAAGDTIVATYTDEFMPNPQSDGAANQVLSQTLTATYFNGSVEPITYEFKRADSGAVQNVRKDLMRIDPGERVVVEITDYDMDQSAELDKLTFHASVNDGEPMEFTAVETGEYTGVFRKEIDTSEMAAEGKLQVKPGDQVVIKYMDRQNTFPGHSVPRVSVVYVRVPTEGKVRVVESRLKMPKEGSKQKPGVIFLPADPSKEVAGVTFEAPFTVVVFDKDQAKDSGSTVTVKLTTTDGAVVKVRCVVSDAYASDKPGDVDRWSLREGRFVGQVIMQLGGKASADIVPLTVEMPRSLTGRPLMPEDEEAEAKEGEEGKEGEEPEAEAPVKPKPVAGAAVVTRVLNLTGKDIVTAEYLDKMRPDKQQLAMTGKARLIANGVLIATDRDYEKPAVQLHVGEKLFLVLTDADLDVSDERDKAPVTISTERGEKETVELVETLAHSGVFTGSFMLKPASKPQAGNLDPVSPEIESFFGDLLTAKYSDKTAASESGTAESQVQVSVVVGTDGLIGAFSKNFEDEELAVDTQFTIAESFFELFKSHKKLGREAEMKDDLKQGRRILRVLVEDYPNPKYVPRINYLLGQFAQELEHWDEAIDAYLAIVRNHPEHGLAPDAQYKLAQCYEESGNFEQALEEYVTLAATYPKSPLIANVMLRICDYFFYQTKDYPVSANVAEKFANRFPGHQWAPKMAFRIGQAYHKAEDFKKSALAFDDFVKRFPDDELAAYALFWSGESYRMSKNVPLAFRRFNRCRWDYPASEAAKSARGRLSLPEMLAQFEKEANLED
jgi:TolA-binding protein